MTALATITGGIALALSLAEPEPSMPEPSPAADGEEVDVREQARALAREGEAAFVAGRFDEASEVYRQAHALDPVPIYLFAWARSEQEAGRCQEAIDLYQRFLASGPPPADEDRAHLEVGRCYAQLSEDEPAPRPEPVEAPEPEVLLGSESEPEPESVERRRSAAWLRDPWGGVMLATGVTGLAVGAGLYLQAQADERRALNAGTTDEFRSASRRATTFSGAGIAGFTVGSALVMGAVIRYAVVSRRPPRAELGVGPRSVGLRIRF